MFQPFCCWILLRCMSNINFIFKKLQRWTNHETESSNRSYQHSVSSKEETISSNGFDKIPLEEAQICTPYITEDESITTSGCARSETYIKCSNCFSKGKEIKELLLIISKQKHSILQLQVKLQKEKRIQTFDISDTQRNFSKLAKIYTSLQNKKFFWLALSIHHGEGWQFTLLSQAKKDKLLENWVQEKHFFLVLTKLRLEVIDSDLVYRFPIYRSIVLVILNAWLSFMANQFTSFICWPSREENKNAFPK